VDQPFGATGLSALRAALATRCRAFGVPAKQIEKLLIIASELMANAIRHGGGGGRLRLWREGSMVRCQVIDRGPGIADAAAGSRPPEPTTTAGGRGLWICRNLAAEIVIDRGPGGRGAAVTATIPGALAGAGST